jgi:endoglucanase
MRNLSVIVALLAAGCAQFRPPASGAAETAASSSCTDEARIEDAEDGDDQIVTRSGRGGYLYTYKDDKGTTIAPSGDFSPSSGGANGSGSALHASGKLGDGGDMYAGLGFGFTEPKQPYDASRWRGIAFWARRGKDGPAMLRLKLPDANTDPDGKVCKDCYNDFGVDFELTEEWTRYVVDFADLKQEGGWGDPRPAAIDPAKLYGIQWQVSGRGAAFDVWIDEVSFVGCPEAQE